MVGSKHDIFFSLSCFESFWQSWSCLLVLLRYEIGFPTCNWISDVPIQLKYTKMNCGVLWKLIMLVSFICISSLSSLAWRKCNWVKEYQLGVCNAISPSFTFSHSSSCYCLALQDLLKLLVWGLFITRQETFRVAHSLKLQKREYQGGALYHRKNLEQHLS